MTIDITSYIMSFSHLYKELYFELATPYVYLYKN